jgi:predicted HTH transcriptional regulator
MMLHYDLSKLEEEVRRRRLPERVQFALSDATLGYKVRNATYRSVAEISETLASRDLKLLVDEGLLVPSGEKRGRSYVGSPILKSIRERTREPRKPRDPDFSSKPYLPRLER